jgi:hypothetical protein
VRGLGVMVSPWRGSIGGMFGGRNQVVYVVSVPAGEQLGTV